MAGRHRLQHGEYFVAADLADDYAVRPHTQRVPDQVALGDLTLAFDVGRPRFEPDHVRLLEAQFGRVFNRHNSLVGRHEQRHAVKQGRFTRAGAAANQDVEPRAHDGAYKLDALWHQRLLRDQIVDVVAPASESANRQRRAVQRQRRNDRVDTRTVGQPRVNHRRRFVNPASDLRHDSIDDQHQVLIVLELDVGGVKLAAFFNVNLAVSVDQDVGDFIIPQKRLQRPKTQQLVLDLLDQVILVDVGEQASLVVQNGGDRRGDFLRRERRLEAFKPGNVQHLEQPVVDRKLELLKTLGLHVFDGALLIAYQRALKRCRRCAVLLRNSLDQLHSVTSSARADYIQQARNQCIWGSAVAGFAAHLEPPRQLLDALGQRRVWRHLPQILCAQLHAIENFFVARNPRVNRLRQRMAQLLFTDRMIRYETAQNEVGFDSRQPQPPHQIDESPRASRRANRLVEQVEQMTRALPGGDRVGVDMRAAIHDHEVEQLARQVEDRTDRLVTDQLAVLDPLGRREQVDSRRMLAER